MKNKAFTLSELLVVIAIIGVIAAIAISSVNSYRAKARDSRRIAELRELQLVLDLYKIERFDYPRGNFHSAALWDSFMNNYFINNGYLSKGFQDPSGQIYRYYSTYSGTYTCNGVVWQNYEYVITFSLERPNPNIPTTNWSVNTHCFHGPLK